MNKGKALSDQIHDAILELVINAGADSDNILFTESELVERFQVSRAPVRESLLKLCNEDVLKSIPRCGYVIVRLGEKSGRDILQVRGLLELGAMDISFDHITAENLAAVKHHLDDAEATLQGSGLWTMWQYNMDFHCLLCSFAGNSYMEKHLADCIAAEKRYYAQNHWDAIEKKEPIFSPLPHQNIYQAICSGDKQKTLALLQRDIFGE